MPESHPTDRFAIGYTETGNAKAEPNIDVQLLL